MTDNNVDFLNNQQAQQRYLQEIREGSLAVPEDASVAEKTALRQYADGVRRINERRTEMATIEAQIKQLEERLVLLRRDGDADSGVLTVCCQVMLASEAERRQQKKAPKVPPKAVKRKGDEP